MKMCLISLFFLSANVVLGADIASQFLGPNYKHNPYNPQDMGYLQKQLVWNTDDLTDVEMEIDSVSECKEGLELKVFGFDKPEANRGYEFSINYRLPGSEEAKSKSFQFFFGSIEEYDKALQMSYTACEQARQELVDTIE